MTDEGTTNLTIAVTEIEDLHDASAANGCYVCVAKYHRNICTVMS